MPKAMARRLINRERRFISLFVSLLLLILVAPAFIDRPYGELILDGLSLVILLTSIFSIRENKKPLAFLVVIAFFILFLTLLKGQFGGALEMADLVLTILFYNCIAGLIIHSILSEKEMTRDLIFGALCAYLLIGVSFAALYRVVEILHPGSFIYSIPISSSVVAAHDLVYFSFTCLSTVGFGDIVPLSPQAKAVIILEEITGVFYLAVLVARLVGNMSSSKDPN